MKLSALSALALVPSVAVAQNSSFVAGLLHALQNANLTQLLTVASTVNGTARGQSLFASISDGSPFVIFAPNNEAWSSAPKNTTEDPNTLADIFSYHIVPGNFSNVATHYPNVTLGQTLYNDTQTVHLEGSKPQVLAWSIRSDNKTHVLNQRNDSTVVNVTTFGNLSIFIIDHVLQVPDSLEITVPADKLSLSSFETVLESATLAFYNASTNSTSDITFFDALNEGFHGFTLFSPNNTAIGAANSTLQSFASNRTALNAVLFNHFINGSTVYSPLLAGSQNYTTTAGETLSFAINATGQYVTLGNTTALIVQPDVLLPNGVVHIIDRVLVDTDSNPSAASSALSSATSAATASQASQTAPIGFSATSSIAAAASSAASSGASSGAVAVGASAQGVLGFAAAVLCAVVGGAVAVF